VHKADVPAARRAVLAIVSSLTPVDTFGAHSAGTVVIGDNYAVHQCGSAMRNHSVDVSVVLPQVAKFSASLAQLDVVVARTRAGWVVFDRRH
jgi:hypothetical protein